MQFLSTISKYFILVVLSLCLLIAWNGVNTNNSDILGLANTSTDSVAKNLTDESIWDSMSREFKLDHRVQSTRVQVEIRRLLADQTKLYQILQAAAPYIYFIYHQTQANGLPAELALIPFIESEFNPNDRSNKGATGLWQLMPQTAQELGVKVRSGYDGRRNVISSTNAALAYFKDLGNNFDGNWYLAIAAYNCGQGCVDSAKRRTGSSNFWDLNRLPKETKYYVPKLLAVAEIVENPDKYGVQLPPISNEPYFKEVKVNKPVNLVKMAETTGVSVKTIQKLNPDYKQKLVVAPKTGARSSVLVPVSNTPAQTNAIEPSIKNKN